MIKVETDFNNNANMEEGDADADKAKRRLLDKVRKGIVNGVFSPFAKWSDEMLLRRKKERDETEEWARDAQHNRAHMNNNYSKKRRSPDPV
jgi:hypothetical protein